jgi:FkbM family methyltransferase
VTARAEAVSASSDPAPIVVGRKPPVLDRLILLGVLATLFFLPLHEKLKAGGFLVTLILWVFDVARRRDRPRIWIPPLGWALLLFVGVAFLSALFSDFHNRATRGALDALRNTLFFLILIDTLDDYKKIRALCGVLMVGLVIADIAAIYHYFFVDPAVMMLSVGEKNSTAQFLGYFLSLSFGLLFGLRKDYLFRGLLVGVTVLTGYVLALTIARGIWVAVVAMIVLFWLVQRDWKIPATVALLAISVWIGMSLNSPFKERILSLKHPVTDFSMVERYEIWRQAIDLFKDRPTLGIGLKTYGYPAMKENYHLDQATNVHNLFLQVLVELGLAGLVALVLWLGVYLRSLFRIYPVMTSDFGRALWLGGLGCFVLLMIGGVAHSMLGSESSLMLMTVLGLMHAGFRVENKRIGANGEAARKQDRPLSAVAAFKRTAFVCFVRGLFFDGSTVRKAEPDTWRFIHDNVESGWRCVDVGANRGEFSVLMARRAGPAAFVYAFELHPENARLLRFNLWRYRRRAKVENLAVTDGKVERVDVFPGRNRSSAEWNIVGHDMACEKKAPEFSVKATSLDDYFQNEERIDLVKIDVEGAAAQVFAGMRRILRQSRPLVILEVHNDSEWEAACRLKEDDYLLLDLQGGELAFPGNFTFHCLALPKERQVTFRSRAT